MSEDRASSAHSLTADPRQMLFVLVALIVVTMLAPRVMRWVFGAVGVIILFAILQTFQAKSGGW
jgi:hypothetical protein